MTRANARELAVHLIYGRDFTGEEPQTVVNTRLDKEYYPALSQENDVYAERPSRAQMGYIDMVVAGVPTGLKISTLRSPAIPSAGISAAFPD